MTSQKELAAMLKGQQPIPQKEAVKQEGEKTEEIKEPEQKVEGQPDVKGAFDKQSNRPSKEQIEQWKIEFGNVFVSAFSDEEVIVWRCLMREEYRRLQMMMAQAENITKADQEEAVVSVCVLWPVEDSAEYLKVFKKAGVFSTLYEQITQASHFVPPGYAGVLVAEL